MVQRDDLERRKVSCHPVIVVPVVGLKKLGVGKFRITTPGKCFQEMDVLPLEHRLPGNLNLSFAFVEGEAMMLGFKDVAVSSGSACTSASLEPSYVLRAMGVGDDLAHSSIRFGIGRFSTEEEVEYVSKLVVEKVAKLREMSPLYEMYQEGIDLKSVQWNAH